MNNVSNAKYDKTSIWFVTLAISIADNWALDTIKIRFTRLIIGPYGSNFATIFDDFISQLKKLAVVESLLWQLGTPFGKHQQKTICVFAKPDINKRGVGRIRDSYANPRIRLGFA